MSRNPRPNSIRTRRVFALIPRRVAGEWVWLRHYALVERYEFFYFDLDQGYDAYEWRVVGRRPLAPEMRMRDDVERAP